MRRLANCILYLVAGIVVSWQSALMASKLARRWSWPLVSRWHSCWDLEHCEVSWQGLVAIALFLFAPPLAWAIAGAMQPRYGGGRQRGVVGIVLVLMTAIFYLVYYAFIWP
jgi:hypothetical protein